jgi:predicted phage terminase large subunit-like protein
MHLTPDEYKTILRQDLYGFVQRSFYELNPQTAYLPNWHIEVIAAELEKCRRGETKRLIINVPPRSLKSHCASIAFPAFLLGHNPAAQIICASYGQQLADKLASDCRSVLLSTWYQKLFPETRLASRRQALNDFMTNQQGFRLSTSVGGILTGRGADYIVIDDPLKPDEALSEVQRQAVNQWYDHTLVSRLNDKRSGCIILIMQRLHEDDLVGHVQTVESWRILKFPAIAEENESYTIQTPYGPSRFDRKAGEALHPDREPLAVLDQLRHTQGEYNFAGQYQQTPAPLGGGMVKVSWFKRYATADLPATFETVFQSWDTANKATELNDYSVCTTWGLKNRKLYLLNVLRRRMEFPELKRAIRDHAGEFRAKNILIEDKASGTQLIQALNHEGVHEVTRYVPKMDKIMRLHSTTNTIENGFVYLPEKAAWLAEYLHELTTFPNGKYDDQADSTSQALDWIKDRSSELGCVTWLRLEARKVMMRDGRWEEVRKMDEKYGPPPEKLTQPHADEPVPYTLAGRLNVTAFQL